MLNLVPLLGLLLACSSTSTVQAYNAYGYENRIPSADLDRVPSIKADAVPGSCLVDVLDYCQKEFATALGSDPAIFKQPVLLKALLAQIYKKQDVNQGFTNMCNARNDFTKCLGDNYDKCTDLFDLIGNQKYGRTDAFILAGIYNNMDFDCASGFTQAVTNFNCVGLVHNSNAYQTGSKTCFDAYNATVTQDQSKFCEASETYSLCLAAIYDDKSVDVCDFKELKWWECERAIRRSKLDGFCNTITCQKLFDSASSNKFNSLMDMIEKNGFVSEIRLKAIQNYHKYAERYAQRLLNRKTN